MSRSLPLKPTPPVKSLKPILSMRHIVKDFLVGKDTVHVLKDICIDIFPQEFVLIYGPSGSGKSTLLNHFLGLSEPTSGRIFINGQDITAATPSRVTKIRYQHFGVVFQNPDWIKSINVLQNVSVPLAIHNVNRRERLEQAAKCLKQLGIADHAAYNPNDLSGGQQQKVAIARAIINDPQIIIADEPTGNLDSESANMVMKVFIDLHKMHGKTIIMVTHNIDYVHFGTRSLFLRDGLVSEMTNKSL